MHVYVVKRPGLEPAKSARFPGERILGIHGMPEASFLIVALAYQKRTGLLIRQTPFF